MPIHSLPVDAGAGAQRPVTRRQWLAKAGGGCGLLGLAALITGEQPLQAGARTDESRPNLALNPMAPRPTHFASKAKRVIWIFVNGGPSQVDTWDYKPALSRWNGKSMNQFDPSFQNTTGFFKNQVGALMQSPFRFSPQGQCGKMVSELFPNLGPHVDKMAFIHSAYSESNNHSPALFMMNTGMSRMGFPCVGSWVTYGLGSESQNLPGFVVMSDRAAADSPRVTLPTGAPLSCLAQFQGTHLHSSGSPIDNLDRPGEMPQEEQRAQLDLVKRLNGIHREQFAAEAALTARIESFELAYRMQSAAPEAISIESEPQHIKTLYGFDDPRCEHVARQCLTARRLVERGVRFVQIYSGGMDNQLSWDGHADIKGNHQQFAGETDRPVAGLLADLEQRGLLDDTLVIWGGEFGRLPIAQTGKAPGRDHNPHGFTLWLAGGGIKGGISHGETDEIGYAAAVNKVHINDLHATILHLLGINHEA